MIPAVQIFNSATLNFRTEVFAVLACIAWTYLLHEHYARKGLKIVDDDDRSRRAPFRRSRAKGTGGNAEKRGGQGALTTVAVVL